MHVEICEKCRRTRLVLMGLLMVFAALAGFHWGSIFESAGAGIQAHDVMVLGVVFTVLALLTALWVETIVTRTEMEAAKAQSEEEALAQEAQMHDERARQLDRLVSKLAEDNKDLRYRLLSAKVHEVGEEMVQDLRGAPQMLSKAS